MILTSPISDYMGLGLIKFNSLLQIAIPGPGVPVPYRFCQVTDLDVSFPLQFHVAMNKGIPGDIIINYTAASLEENRLSELRIFYNCKCP